MRKIKVLFIGLLFTLLLVLGINSYASVNVEVSLKQQESNDHNNSVRYVGTITGLDYSEIKNYSVSISMYDTNGTLSKSNTKTYTTLYDKVVGVSTVAQDKVYYAVFTLTDLSSYTGYKLDCSFTFNLENGDKYTTNHKYFEIGTKYAINATSYAGYDEGCFMEFDPYNNDTDPSNYVAEYRNLDSSTWTYNTIDNELIRYADSKFRVDMVGLKEGNYTLRVSKVINGVKYVTDEVVVTVSKTDRSGYAHFNYSEGVGAYNNDGTLKSGAVVVYVNDSNKNTVTATISGTTYTGLVKILQAQSKSSVPLDIRILDEIKTNQWNVKSDAPRLADNSNSSVDADFWNNTLETTYGDNLAGLTMIAMDKKTETSYKWLTTATGLQAQTNGSTSSKTTTYKGSESAYKDLYGKTVYDDDSYWNMLDISEASNVTVEGIGENAGVFQWGFTWKNCNSIEIKNLSFTDYTEDACSFEGGSVTSYGNYWFHNNEINRGKNNWDVSGERDKYAGDGGMDLKKVHNVTMSYCHVYNSKKTGLVGGSDTDLTMNITFHHNYYENVESRLPLGRQANMHFYNNYYKNSTSYSNSIRANAFVFSEYNYFEGGKNPHQLITQVAVGSAATAYTPVIKTYNNEYAGSISLSDDSDKTSNSGKTTEYRTITHNFKENNASTREQSFEGNCKPDGKTNYTNFDTNSSLFYYDSVNRRSDVELLQTASEAKETVLLLAGVLSSGHYNNVVENTTPPAVDPGDTYTVTFNNDGSITTATVTSGEKVAEPTAPSKSGYTFDGWYLNDAKYDFNTAVTSNITLVAKWTANTTSTEATTVIYYFDGTVATSPNYSFTTKYEGSSGTLGDLTIDASSGKLAYNTSGYTQWNISTPITFTAVAGTKIRMVSYQGQHNYTVDGVAANADDETFTISTSKVVTLVATATAYIYRIEIETPGSSTAETYSVTYNINGHGTAPSNLTGQTNLPTTLPVLTESGYTFGGWYLDEALTEKAVAGATLSSNVVLYAKWISNTTSTTPVIDETIKYNFDYSSNNNYIDPNISNSTTEIGPFTFTAVGDMKNNGTGWTYFKEGSTIKFSVASPSSIVFDVYPGTTYTLTGTNVTNNGAKYYVGAGEVTITSTSNGYFDYIEITKGETDPSLSSVSPTSIAIAPANIVKSSSNTSAGNGVYYAHNFKQIYTLNESLDLSHLYAFVTFADDTKTGFGSSSLTVTGFDSSSVGKKTITITYTCSGGSIATTYDVYVVSTTPSIVNGIMQVKVSKSYTGTIGAVVDGYTMFTNINQALDYIRTNKSAATNKYLYIEAGTYNEKVEIDIPNLHIVGAGATNTIIEYDSLYGIEDANGFSHITDSTMTMAVRDGATNCIIENITISNYYNHISKYTGSYTGNGERGLALLVQADMFIMNGCRLLGWQDTLETFTGRQYFYNTYICGCVDFIFGTNSTTYFQNCQIEAIKSKTSYTSSSSTTAYVTAYKGLNKNSDDAVTYGAIFDGCNFTTASDFIGKVALARPWTQYSAVAVLNSTFSSNYLTAASKTIMTGLAYVYGSTTTKISSWANVTTLKFKAYNNSSTITEDITGVSINLDSSTAANYSDFSVIFGKTNGGVTYSSAWNPTKYDGSSSGSGDSGNSSETETPETPSTGEKIVHNFTTDGKNSDLFTITGNLSTSKGTVTYDGLTLTQCLKMESSTSITFTLDTAKTIKLVFVEKTGNVKIDDISYSVNENGIVSTTLSLGSHTITKGDSINLFYIVLE